MKDESTYFNKFISIANKMFVAYYALTFFFFRDACFLYIPFLKPMTDFQRDWYYSIYQEPFGSRFFITVSIIITVVVHSADFVYLLKTYVGKVKKEPPSKNKKKIGVCFLLLYGCFYLICVYLPGYPRVHLALFPFLMEAVWTLILINSGYIVY